MNFEDDFFNVINYTHVLEHAANNRKELRELYKVLKSEGFTIFKFQFLKMQKNL